MAVSIYIGETEHIERCKSETRNQAKIKVPINHGEASAVEKEGKAASKARNQRERKGRRIYATFLTGLVTMFLWDSANSRQSLDVRLLFGERGGEREW